MKKFIFTLTTLLLSSFVMLAIAINADVVVNTYDSQGNVIAAKYQVFKGPNYIGQFDAGTAVSLVVGDSYRLFAHYQNTSTERVTFTVDAAGNTFNFSTTNVTFHWTGGYLEYRGSGSWSSFGQTGGVWNSRELFPKDFYGNTMQFHIGYKWNDVRGMIFTLDYSGQSTVEKVLSQLRLLDHNGNPLSGGTARGGFASPTQYFVSGATNAAGLLLDIRDGSNSNRSFEMKYNNTTSWSAQQTSSIYEFQTDLITMRLEKCDGTPLDGGNVRWGNGSSYSTYFFPGGSTGSSAPGETSAEFFPGTYSFEMGLNGTANQKISYSFPADGAKVTWQSTSVTLNYAGSISFGGPTGDSRWFNKPTMELMPGGTYKFHFRGADRFDITIVGCDLEKTPIFVQLKDSQGNGLANGDFNYRFGYGAYTNIGVDNTGDGIWYLLDGNPGNTKVKVSYKGASVEKQQNVQSNPLFIFNTVLVTANLESSTNADLTAGASFQYRFGYGSYTAFDPVAGEELLPVNTKVKVTYKGAGVENQQNINSDASFDFNTVNITGQLLSSTNTDLTGDASFQYRFGYGSYTAFDPVAGEELLPVNTKVKVTYKGAGVENQQNINSDASFDFSTVNVTATLTDGGADVTGSGTWLYRYGYGSYSAFNPAGEELLPVNTKVKVSYAGTSDEKQQNVGSAPVFSFAYDGSSISKSGLANANGVNISLYPNPANIIANITYDVPQRSNVELTVFTMTGQQVAQLHSGEQNEGKQVVEWDVRSMTPGTYVVRLIVGETITHERIVIAR